MRLSVLFIAQTAVLSAILTGIVISFHLVTTSSIRDLVRVAVNERLRVIEASGEVVAASVWPSALRAGQQMLSLGVEPYRIGDTREVGRKMAISDAFRGMDPLVAAALSTTQSPHINYVFVLAKAPATGVWSESGCGDVKADGSRYYECYLSLPDQNAYTVYIDADTRVRTIAWNDDNVTGGADTYNPNDYGGTYLPLAKQSRQQPDPDIDKKNEYGAVPNRQLLDLDSAERNRASSGEWASPYARKIDQLNYIIQSFVLPVAFDAAGDCMLAVAVDVSHEALSAALSRVANSGNTMLLLDERTKHVLALAVDPAARGDLDIDVPPAGEAWVNLTAANPTMFNASETPSPRLNAIIGALQSRGLLFVADSPVLSHIEFEGDIVGVHRILPGNPGWVAIDVTPRSRYFAYFERQVLVVTLCAVALILIYIGAHVLVFFSIVRPIATLTQRMNTICELRPATPVQRTRGKGAMHQITVSGPGVKRDPSNGAALVEVDTPGNPYRQSDTASGERLSPSTAAAKPLLHELHGLHASFLTLDAAVQSFTRYVPRGVVRGLMSSGQLCELAMRKASCAVLFCDMKGFTTITETTAPEALSALMTRFFETQTSIIARHGGIIDKYIGDCVMAMWGAPVAVPRQCARAALCSVRLSAACRPGSRLFSEFEKGGVPLGVRVGVHQGDVLVGNMGCAMRMNYTCIGDVVNTASRLESLNRRLGTTNLVSADVVEAAKLRELVTRCMGRVAVPGKSEPLVVHEVIGVTATEHADAVSRRRASRTRRATEDPTSLAAPLSSRSDASAASRATGGTRSGCGRSTVSSGDMYLQDAEYDHVDESSDDYDAAEDQRAAAGADAAAGASGIVDAQTRRQNNARFALPTLIEAVRKVCPVGPSRQDYFHEFTTATEIAIGSDFAGALQRLDDLLAAPYAEGDAGLKNVRAMLQDIHEGTFDGVLRFATKS